MKKLSLLADENIPNLAALCASWCDIKTLSGREISASDLTDVDILFVRSVTKVNAALLENSHVKFVGSATIGVDHIDTDYLAGRGIGFAHAPGSNANGVVDYVMSTILDNYDNETLSNITVGVVGHGNVGSRLARCLRHFSIPHAVYDPLFDFSATNSPSVQHIEALMSSDVISAHVPLTTHLNSQYPTKHLFNTELLTLLKSHCLFINSSRGPVVSNNDLKALLHNRSDITAVLDVWESEPDIDLELFELCQHGTPHIAGYSIDGKHRGISAIVSSALGFFDLPAIKPTKDADLIRLNDLTTLDEYRSALAAVYSPKADAERFKEKLNSGNDVAQVFDAYRKAYPVRREINYDG